MERSILNLPADTSVNPNAIRSQMPPPVEGFAARLVLGPALRTQPDRRLVALVRDGYETAFDEIVRRYSAPLRRYAAAIVGGRSEDVTQDAFSKALLALRRDGAEIELRPWLFRIVRNTALNDLRDTPPTPEAPADAIAGGSNPAEEFGRREELAELIGRLRSLPESQRAAIVMRELEGLGHEEIATALGLSGGAARQAIYRARQALRDGFGMLLPIPALRALLSGTSSAPFEAAAAGAGSAGVVLKAATATVLVVGAIGAGVGMDHGRHESRSSANLGRVDFGGSSKAAPVQLRSGPVGHPTPDQTEQDPGAQSPQRKSGTAEQGASTEQGGGQNGRGGKPAPASQPTDGGRGGKDIVWPGTAEEGGSPSGDEGSSSGGSVGGSPDSGGDSGSIGDGGEGSISAPSNDTTGPTAEEDPTTDGQSSNSGPDSGDGGAERPLSSDVQRDPHGATVFSVQETQP
jgi:RNA polymerase sigma factor (sigma-70 family)